VVKETCGNPRFRGHTVCTKKNHRLEGAREKSRVHLHQNFQKSVDFSNRMYLTERPIIFYYYSYSASYFLNLGARWGYVVNATPRPLFTLGKLCRRLGGTHGWSGRVRKISPPDGIRSSDRPARSESLYRLSYSGPRQ